MEFTLGYFNLPTIECLKVQVTTLRQLEFKWDFLSTSNFGHMCLSHKLYNPMLPAKILEV